MEDHYGREIRYLRISVTDRCNLRCVYCMPPEGIQWQPHNEILSYEEIVSVVRVAASQGIRQIRLTGGEPLVRAGLSELVRQIAEVPGIEDIALTTNAILLASQAEALAQAGLKRVNISLDTLQADKFARITRGGSIERVWEGIAAAEANGLKPIKINAVVVRGLNDDEMEAMARLTLEHDWHMRFIELMPIQNQQSWGEGLPDPATAHVSVTEMMTRLSSLGLEPVDSEVGLGPAQEFRLRGGLGRVGFISPLSDHSFCQRCNRMRLTADGSLRPCLMSDEEVALRDVLRAGKDILPLYQEAITGKPKGHHLAEHLTPSGRCMTQIGG